MEAFASTPPHGWTPLDRGSDYKLFLLFRLSPSKLVSDLATSSELYGNFECSCNCGCRGIVGHCKVLLWEFFDRAENAFRNRTWPIHTARRTVDTRSSGLKRDSFSRDHHLQSHPVHPRSTRDMLMLPESRYSSQCPAFRADERRHYSLSSMYEYM